MVAYIPADASTTKPRVNRYDAGLTYSLGSAVRLAFLANDGDS